MTKLSSKIDHNQLKDLIKEKKRIKIADFVFQRFEERYIIPIKVLHPDQKHGFSIMAISCLMIESLQSFKSGYENTKSKSQETFVQFLSSEPLFEKFKGFEKDFYINIRCGILHQSETINGWKVLRKGELFNNITKTINASKFLDNLEITLHNYTSILKTAEWDSKIWKQLIKKLESIINNC